MNIADLVQLLDGDEHRSESPGDELSEGLGLSSLGVGCCPFGQLLHAPGVVLHDK